METFKILTLDGGGVRGYLSILMLEKIEKALERHFQDGKPIGARFDLIVGTSTGGIIATALSLHRSAAQTRVLYEELLKKIFTPVNKGLIKPKYNQKILKKHIKEIVGEKTFNDVLTPLCLTSVDISTAKSRFFKSPYLEAFLPRADEKLLDAALATSAAPIFFPLVHTKYSHFLADGGIVANNPAMVGVVDGYRITKDLHKLRLLSIGTGEIKFIPYDVYKIEKGGGIFSWAVNSNSVLDPVFKTQFVVPIMEVLFNAQSTLVNNQVDNLLGENFLRINPVLPSLIRLDDAQKLEIMKNVANVVDEEKTIRKIVGIFKA
ncbi:CBASS cGAMP-activated phospholipase [Hydrogenimonas sp.]